MILTEWTVHPERYEWNQLRGVLVIPIKESLSRRMVCEIVSKAALKSSRRRMDSKPESAAKRRSLLILRSAVSVLWRGRKPDWNCSCKLLQKRWVWSWAATIISRILEMNGRFEIGQKKIKVVGIWTRFLDNWSYNSCFERRRNNSTGKGRVNDVCDKRGERGKGGLYKNSRKPWSLSKHARWHDHHSWS